MKLKLGILILFLFVCSNVLAVEGTKNVDESNLYKKLELLGNVITLIQENYVEEVTPKQLVYGALEGMLSSLDLHSQFLNPEAYEEIRIETEGEFGGLGIVITIRDGILTVVSPIDGTPAHEVGLESGDMIVEIEGETTKNITLTEAVKKLRGEPGTDVSITVLREDSSDKILKFTIKRDIIKIKSIKEAKMLENNIGYVKLIDFQEDTAIKLKKELNKLESKGMNSLILDLRNNPGGLLDIAVDVSEIFIREGKVIVTTKGRGDSQTLEFLSENGKKYRNYPLVVLINKGSASGSEIVAGAIQDYKLGILIGSTSFGKGSVQTVIPLSDKSALRLTTSKYFTPSGRSIHHKGIIPDIEVKYEKVEKQSNTNKKNEVFKQLKDEKNVPEDKTEDIKKSKDKDNKFQYDSQLLRAMDLLKGIKIYRDRLKNLL